MPYRLSALAEQDLEEIWSYVAGDASPATADRLIDAIIERFELTFHRPAQTGCWLVRQTRGITSSTRDRREPTPRSS
jgi:plasmid stabilization system protein ParE